MPKLNSLWIDADSGCDFLYQFKGICNSGLHKGQYHLARFDYKTQKASGGNMWIGASRFREDMRSTTGLAVQPCCGQPTLYPRIWCDDCGYEKWSAARDAKEKAA